MVSSAAETVEIPRVGAEVDYARIATSTGFAALRRRFLRFVVPMTATYLLWYLLFVLLAMYAPGFMAIKVVGHLTVGLVMGGLQFLSTFALAVWYVRYAGATLDPAAAAVREEVRAGLPEEGARSERPGPFPPSPASGAGHRMWEPSVGRSPNRDRLPEGGA